MPILFDNASNGAGSASSISVPHTVGAGSNRVIFVEIVGGSGAPVSTITYAGQAMSEVVPSFLISGGTERHSLYYLVNPATGTNNVSITFGGSSPFDVIVTSYTGAKQTGTIGQTFTSATSENSTTTDTESLTTTTDNSWVMWVCSATGSGTFTGGANTAMRNRIYSQRGAVFADSNNPVTPAGVRALTLDSTTTSSWTSDILFEVLEATGGAGGALGVPSIPSVPSVPSVT